MPDSLPFIKSFQKQGILTILPSYLESPTNPPPSLRRTLSADMSSRKWFTRHGFSSINKISSSSSSQGQHDSDDFKEPTIEIDSPKQRDLDSWTSILSHNSAPKSALVPYVHSLEKSTNCLSEKSLLICTESLGSESGSDGFSSYPSSEAGDSDFDFDGHVIQTQTFQWNPIKFGRKKSPPRSFPPPISSLTSPDGGSVRIQSRRENGRLILDAVSVPSQKNFSAERRDGRLILSFVTTPPNVNFQDHEEELIPPDFEEVKESRIAEERDEENDFEAHELQIPMVKALRLSSSVMNPHRLVIMMKKHNRLINRNPVWPKEKDAPEPPTPLSQSLPPLPPSIPAATATSAASLNAYEYYWRSKPTAKSAGIQNGQQQNQPIKSITVKLISSNNQMANEKQQILVLRGNRDDLVPLSNGCKVPRRSLLLRPCCIATT